MTLNVLSGDLPTLQFETQSERLSQNILGSGENIWERVDNATLLFYREAVFESGVRRVRNGHQLSKRGLEEKPSEKLLRSEGSVSVYLVDFSGSNQLNFLKNPVAYLERVLPLGSLTYYDLLIINQSTESTLVSAF